MKRKSKMIGYLLIGILAGTCLPAKSMAQEKDNAYIPSGFVTLGVGASNVKDILRNSELTAGKWFGKERINGVRASVGSSTAFRHNNTEGIDRDYNITAGIDYLCNLTSLLSDRKNRIFNLIFLGGMGCYFPASESSSTVILNGRLGFQGQIRLSRHLGAWLEPRINLFKDKGYREDMQEPIRGEVGLMIGMSYKF